MEFRIARTRRRTLRATIATAAVLAVAAASVNDAKPASAYVIQGHAWPGHVITYHNTFPADAAAVAAAVRDWNTSGADVRFVSAPASQAEVTIAEMPSNFLDQGAGAQNSDLLGSATVGMVPRDAVVTSPSGAAHDRGAHVWLVRIGSRSASGVTVSLGTMERVAAHEFGHVLGLGHERHVCAVMQPALSEGCGIPHPWIGLCPDPLQPDDIRGAVSLYGGREPAGGKHLCTLSPAPPAVSVSASLAAGYRLTLRWRNPAGVSLPAGAFDPYSLAGRPTIAAYEIESSRHGCPAPRHDVIERLPARPRARMRITIGLVAGSWCLRVRIGDVFHRWGPAATLRVTVAASG